MIDIVLASKNKHKAEEIKAILGENYNILTQTEAGAGDIDVMEDGATFEENAVKKAKSIMWATGRITIADDSGLEVAALDGRPGIYTARFAGENATDEENIDKLLEEMKYIPMYKRNAKFVCCIAAAIPNGKVKTYRGECEGKILYERQGDNGFGYDPVFLYEKYACSLAMLEPEIKNSISHRANALKLMSIDFNKMKNQELEIK